MVWCYAWFNYRIPNFLNWKIICMLTWICGFSDYMNFRWSSKFGANVSGFKWMSVRQEQVVFIYLKEQTLEQLSGPMDFALRMWLI